MPGNTATPTKGAVREAAAAELGLSGPQYTTGTRQVPAATARAQLHRLLAQIDLDEAMRRRSVQQAILQAESWWWRWRAEQFDWARPRLGDFNGQATAEMLADAELRCRGTRDACLARAALIEYEAGGGLDA
jgi:hypothetical protein